MIDSREFSLRVWVRAPFEAVEQAWTTAAGLGRWFVSASHQGPSGQPWRDDVPVEEGCRYRWTWGNGIAGEGEFTQVQEGLVAFTFGDDVGVVVRMAWVDGRVLVELTQRNGQATEAERLDCAHEYAQGWTFFLANLRSVLQGGLDLRETEEFVSGLVNV